MFLFWAFTTWWALPALEATGTTKAVNWLTNVGALTAFLTSGPVLWSVALSMAAANLVGGWLGAHTAIRTGVTFIRITTAVVSAAASVYLLLTSALEVVLVEAAERLGGAAEHFERVAPDDAAGAGVPRRAERLAVDRVRVPDAAVTQLGARDLEEHVDEGRARRRGLLARELAEEPLQRPQVLRLRHVPADDVMPHAGRRDLLAEHDPADDGAGRRPEPPRHAGGRTSFGIREVHGGEAYASAPRVRCGEGTEGGAGLPGEGPPIQG